MCQDYETTGQGFYVWFLPCQRIRKTDNLHPIPRLSNYAKIEQMRIVKIVEQQQG